MSDESEDAIDESRLDSLKQDHTRGTVPPTHTTGKRTAIMSDETAYQRAASLEEPERQAKPPVERPCVGSRWMRNTPHDPNLGPYNGYTILFITNIAYPHQSHPPQVVYLGDNGLHWSLPLRRWPGNLVPEVRQV